MKSYLDPPSMQKEKLVPKKHNMQTVGSRDSSPRSQMTPLLQRNAEKPPKAVKVTEQKP